MDQVHPLVSIAIITYNQKEYLRECIESCLAQDYPNFEIVVADDFSTDGTQGMLHEYEQKHPNKFILKLAEKNQGITANSNVAHFSCSGKYIAWMGGDDLMLPNKISKQVGFMESNPECSICYHDLDVFDSDSNKTLYIWSRKSKPREGDVRVSIKYGTFNGACSNMVKRDKTPANGFSELLPVASDWLYWVDTLGHGGKILYINEILGRYRRHANNISSPTNYFKQGSIDHLNSCNIILANYPEYLNEALHRYSINIRGNRAILPYFSSLFFCFRNTLDLKSLFGLFMYTITFKNIKK